MIRLCSVAALAVLAAQPATALSCLAPTVERSTAQAVAAEETYVIVVGSFDFEPVEMPFDGTTPGEGATIPATFEGRTLTAEGFTKDVEGELVIEIGCAGPWCGNMTPGGEVLAFLRQGPSSLILDVGACPQWVFDAPTQAQRETVLACVTGDNCSTE